MLNKNSHHFKLAWPTARLKAALSLQWRKHEDRRQRKQIETFFCAVVVFLPNVLAEQNISLYPALHWLPLAEVVKYLSLKGFLWGCSWKEIVFWTVACWLKSFISWCEEANCKCQSFSDFVFLWKLKGGERREQDRTEERTGQDRKQHNALEGAKHGVIWFVFF